MICNNCKAEIADSAKLCPLCHVVPVIMFGKPKNTGPSPAGPARGGGLWVWIVLAAAVGAGALASLNPEGSAALADKFKNMMGGVKVAKDSAGRQSAQTDETASQLKEMGVLTDQTAAGPAEPAKPDPGLKGLWAKVFHARDKAQAHQTEKVAEMNAVDDQLGPAAPPPPPDALELLKEPAAKP
jgi:hypothetical protein